MKKGFTLIELLAVILILGIIALIAIPTVNKVLDEARLGAFKTTSENVIKAVEQQCQISTIKGDTPELMYVIKDGKINNDLPIKGSLPDSGYIYLDNECTIEEYHLTQSKYVYSNIKDDDLKTNYMLKAPTENEKSIFETLYPEYFANIKSISFINNLNIPGNAISIKDPSVSEKGKIKSWLIEDNGLYNLYIGSNNKIYGNYDSSYLFGNLLLITNYDFSNFNTSFIEKMYSMFVNNQAITNLDLKFFDTSNVTNMHLLFDNCFSLTNLDISNFNTKNVTTMANLFDDCASLTTIDVSGFDTSKVTNMWRMFGGNERSMKLTKIIGLEDLDTTNVVNMGNIFYRCSMLETLDLSKWNTSKVTNMDSMFANCYNLKSINLSNFNTSKTTTMSYMFNNCLVLENLNLNSFDTKNVTNMYAMFSDLNSMTSIDVSGFNTSKVVNMEYMFDGIEHGSALTEIKGLENFDFTNVQNVGGMFAGTNKLKKIEFSNANNSNILNISIDRLGTLISIFYNCNSLEYLDLGNLNLNNVSDMNLFMSGLTNIKTIKYNNAAGIKRLIEYFPVKDVSNVGTLIIDDTSKLTTEEINILNSKNWNIA